MTLRLEPRVRSSVPLEVDGIVPDQLRSIPLAEIEKREIFRGNTKVPLAEFFRISGDPSDGKMEWEGDFSGVHWIGAKMSGGLIRVRGHVGRHLGSEMQGGEVWVDGDASDWVGGEMRGGLIQVRGRAGHLVGAAYRGSPVGMTGGTILVHGAAGNEIGRSMRRGLIAVGAAGDLAAFNMRAGTVVVAADAGIRHGAGMRRGTVVFLGARPNLLGTFRRACRFRPAVMNLLIRRLEELGYPVPAGAKRAEFELFNGDLLEGGRGEILTIA